MVSFRLFTSLAMLASLAVAAPQNFLEKRATGPSCQNSDFKKAIVDTHNAHRKVHQVGNLKWDDTLANFANQAANKCKFAHTGGQYGENLFGIWPGYNNWSQGTVSAVKAWAYEAKNYNYKKPGFSPSTGHFTQLVWKSTTKVGCSWNTVPCDGAAYLFCEYDEPGNWDGEYQANVLPYKKN